VTSLPVSTWGLSFLIAVCSPPRHVEVSGWIAAMQEFMYVVSEEQFEQDYDQSNALNKTYSPLDVSKAFCRFEFEVYTLETSGRDHKSCVCVRLLTGGRKRNS
uniref:Uncharacterized protein n=1 Tax=Neolamprologus brichardi TaxID=32507 RepID=A0A3Q4MTJ1_NEOBR